MIFLYSSISSSKSVFGMVVISSPSFRSYCTCWTSASVLGCFGTGLPAAFLCTMFLLVLRLVSVLVPLVCFACCWLCSSRFFSSLLQIFEVLLAVLVPVLLYFILLALARCLRFCLGFSQLAPWLWFPSVLSLSPLALWLWSRLCFFFSVTL